MENAWSTVIFWLQRLAQNLLRRNLHCQSWLVKMSVETIIYYGGPHGRYKSVLYRNVIHKIEDWTRSSCELYILTPVDYFLDVLSFLWIWSASNICPYYFEWNLSVSTLQYHVGLGNTKLCWGDDCIIYTTLFSVCAFYPVYNTILCAYFNQVKESFRCVPAIKQPDRPVW